MAAELMNSKQMLLEDPKKDYGRAVQAAGERKYNEWKEFRRWVLDPAVKDMNASTEILVEYSTPKRVKDKIITFRVRYKSENAELPGEETKKELSEQEKESSMLKEELGDRLIQFRVGMVIEF